MGRPDEEDLIATLDTGTSSIRCMIFNSRREVLAKHQVEIQRKYPAPSWVEQDAAEIIDKSVQCINQATDDLVFSGYSINNIKGLGIANQRETTVVWDKHTGKPLYNAILWLDNRTAELAESYIKGKGKGDKNCLRGLCGLPIHPYFSALKLRWIIDNVPAVRDALGRNSCLFGTVDSWVLWSLSGGIDHGVHKTDVTNASRTMLMNLKTLDWDDKLVDFFELPRQILPKICSSSEVFGDVKISNILGVPVCGMLGDQQAALVGHGCFQPGTAKNTYGTGCFLLANIGVEPKISVHGLLTTVAYQMGPKSSPVYAFEGSAAMCGAMVNWLQKNLGLIEKAEEIDELAGSVDDSGGIFFVPAFSGLLAPYWDTEARGVICGLTEYVEKAHFARAALEAVAYQTCEMLDSIKEDSGIQLTQLQVDGGMSGSSLLMQIQSNYAGIPVHTPPMVEITSLGAAVAVSKALNLPFSPDGKSDDISVSPTVKPNNKSYYPAMQEEQRKRNYLFWKEAVRRSMGWTRNPAEANHNQSKTSLTASCYAATAAASAVTTLAIAGLVTVMVSKYWK